MLRTKKEIAKTVIRDYEEIIKEGEKMRYKDLLNFISNKNAEFGICMYCRLTYNVDISERPFINKYVLYYSNGRKFRKDDLGSGYWYKTPDSSRTKKEAIECLQKRIDILKTWL